MAQPTYDRAAQKAGIVHFGIGAFHRGHQAVFVDDAMNAGDRDWAIHGVSLRSSEVARRMNPQGGLYTVTERGRGGERTRLIGAIAGVTHAGRDPAAVIEAIASPHVHIVSFTITEKGYQNGPDGAPPLFQPTLSKGLARRRAAGLGGLTLISCDNLSDNGARLAALVEDGLETDDPALAGWFRAHCACPSTMVDRIVPATTGADLDTLAVRLGLRDEAAVVTEPFRQWVIEDRFAGPRPRWERCGVQFTADVRAFEAAKLRMLNGAHSALAYLGLARGHAFVHQAIADPQIAPLIDRLMGQEAAASLTPAPGQDLAAYAEALTARFANPALNHRLAQIAQDGSQKIPQRWLPTLAFHQRAGRRCPAILTALAAWIVHARGDARRVEDPRAEELAALWRNAGREGIVTALFGENGLFAASWMATAEDERFLLALF